MPFPATMPCDVYGNFYGTLFQEPLGDVIENVCEQGIVKCFEGKLMALFARRSLDF